MFEVREWSLFTTGGGPVKSRGGQNFGASTLRGGHDFSANVLRGG